MQGSVGVVLRSMKISQRRGDACDKRALALLLLAAKAAPRRIGDTCICLFRLQAVARYGEELFSCSFHCQRLHKGEICRQGCATRGVHVCTLYCMWVLLEARLLRACVFITP